MFEHERGETNTLMLSVQRLSGTKPSFPTDYSTPEVRISHINGAGEIEDLAFTAMSQADAGALINRWYHKYTVPINATFTKYLVTFKTIIEGIETEVTEEFKVVPTIATSGGELPGAGEHDVTVTVKNPINNQPIAGVTIRVFAKAVPTSPIAAVKTDTAGQATVFLDAGTYLIEFSKTGVISEVHDLVVNTNGTHDVKGD